MQLLARRRLQQLHQGRLPRLAEGEVRHARRRSRRAWHRYSYAEWDDIEPPVADRRPIRECLDWLHSSATTSTARCSGASTPSAPSTEEPDRRARRRQRHPEHGRATAATTGSPPPRSRSTATPGSPARKGSQPWRNFYGVDITRAAARGKPFWHAERQGGPLWMQPQVLGRDKEDGRVAEPEDIRVWSHDLLRRRRHAA